jgi:uncharacterized protein
MTALALDARRLDVARFAAAGAELSGEWPLSSFQRLQQDLVASPGPAEPVRWTVRGEYRATPAGVGETRLALRAAAAVWLRCQRCLQPMPLDISIDTRVRFVDGEAEAERLDEIGDEDVLAISSALDVHELFEDELILTLPLVPRHDDCALLADAPDDGAAEPGEPHPFAALAALRRGPGGTGQ